MDDFKTIIGSGGFGLVVAHAKQNIVAKYLYESECANAEKEFKIHSLIYEAFRRAADSNRTLRRYPQICIPKPLGYDNDIVIKFGKIFQCYYVMSRLNIINTHGLYHVVKDSTPGVDREIGRIYSEPISESNPTRGFFASYHYVQTILLDKQPDKRGEFRTINDVIRYIGWCFGVMVFLAEYNPKDVEYALGMRPNSQEMCLCVLDFGMAQPINFLPDAIDDRTYSKKISAIARELEDNIDVDIYFPDDEDRLEVFMNGVSDAVELLETKDPAYKEKQTVFEKLRMLITGK